MYMGAAIVSCVWEPHGWRLAERLQEFEKVRPISADESSPIGHLRNSVELDAAQAKQGAMRDTRHCHWLRPRPAWRWRRRRLPAGAARPSQDQRRNYQDMENPSKIIGNPRNS